MDRTTDYAALLKTSYSEYRTVLRRRKNGFTFVIRNPERKDGDITLTERDGSFTLRFFSMEEDFADDYAELVAFVDELIYDESMIFEFCAEGEYVLGGSRGTDAIGRPRERSKLIRELADGDFALRCELLAYLEKPACAVRMRGWRAARCFSIILNK